MEDGGRTKKGNNKYMTSKRGEGRKMNWGREWKK